MKKLTVVPFAILIVALLISGCSREEDSKETAIETFRINSGYSSATYGTDTSITHMLDGLVKTWPENCDGINVELYLDGQLGSGTTASVTGVAGNAFQFSHASTANLAEYSDAFVLLSVPFLYRTPEIAWHVIDSDIGDSMKEQFTEDTGLVCLMLCDIGMRQITNNKREIHTPADMNGLKIRVQSDPVQVAAFEALGASALTTPFNEVFTSIQTNLCDGQENPTSSIISSSIYDIQDYMTLINHSYGAICLFMNKAKYDSLTEEQRTALDFAMADAESKARESILRTEESDIAFLENEGMRITTLTDDEWNSFRDIVEAEVWPDVEEMVGEDTWNHLMDVIEEAERMYM